MLAMDISDPVKVYLSAVCQYITMALCHLPMSDVDEPVFGHRQWEGSQVTAAEYPGDIGAHVLQERDAGRDPMNDGSANSDMFGLLKTFLNTFFFFFYIDRIIIIVIMESLL